MSKVVNLGVVSLVGSVLVLAIISDGLLRLGLFDRLVDGFTGAFIIIIILYISVITGVVGLFGRGKIMAMIGLIIALALLFVIFSHGGPKMMPDW